MELTSWRWRWVLFEDDRPYPRPAFSWTAWSRGVPIPFVVWCILWGILDNLCI